jgi:hypothetical protein
MTAACEPAAIRSGEPPDAGESHDGGSPRTDSGRPGSGTPDSGGSDAGFDAGVLDGEAVLAGAEVFNSPPDVASWSVTTEITRIEMRDSSAGDDAGLSFRFSARDSWPDYTPPGWDGPIQYTVWPVVNVGGRWYTSGIIQMWRDRAATGAPLLTDFAINWVYDGRWGRWKATTPSPESRWASSSPRATRAASAK